MSDTDNQEMERIRKEVFKHPDLHLLTPTVEQLWFNMPATTVEQLIQDLDYVKEHFTIQGYTNLMTVANLILTGKSYHQWKHEQMQQSKEAMEELRQQRKREANDG